MMTQVLMTANISPGYEVEVEIDLPDGCKARDVDVKIKTDNVSVKICDRTIVHGDLLNRCDPEAFLGESYWEIRGTRLVVILQKVFVKDCKQTLDIEDLL
ncbi:hypothetical protein AK812_SmicGene8360 [Symbiodinium microadriaticum]|uniref:CS domain-containing protein n=1 Tax=Symbiodinium microadriaticum TaxID=2951 RepID=A0A1Q9EL80_SYMMI|nr:hypothetical protein AK812_SmicGene8360 [Symbiodinium microadriaticum]